MASSFHLVGGCFSWISSNIPQKLEIVTLGIENVYSRSNFSNLEWGDKINLRKVLRL